MPASLRLVQDLYPRIGSSWCCSDGVGFALWSRSLQTQILCRLSEKLEADDFCWSVEGSRIRTSNRSFLQRGWWRKRQRKVMQSVERSVRFVCDKGIRGRKFKPAHRLGCETMGSAELSIVTTIVSEYSTCTNLESTVRKNVMAEKKTKYHSDF